MPKRTILSLVLATLLAACGGARETTTTTTTTTTGGEATATAEAHPILTTTPIPVPQPAIPREAMSADLQRVWELVEIAVAIRPPEPPTDGSLDGVTQWAEGPFTTWLVERARASGDAQDALGPLEEAPAHERGVAAGLLGYLQETTCSDVRGAPIPDSISSDAELLQVYDRSLHDALLPYARVSVQAYRFCGAAFEESGDAAWTPWFDYCAERAGEVARVFGVETSDAPAASPSSIEDPEE